ncbi:DUF262 domain-containing protein [Tenacibaculum finnmarkense]|uniref:GmrSD restriction endonuclease domain-containing protein n=1 Tax=Tenacibaculum finnmarkense TaxID=2781243 RepID=UPI001EFB9484|nr:DUF262 domain-containing protein [Tenacibaculum finnmarkense]MCG8785173.1 DUF262 domain-containing protein [Tenacibaculum finnmarkense]
MKEGIYNTFWKIIEHCRIEIPIIQRDYTYGRKTAATIKEKIVKDIYNALEEQDNFLHLDFIYGKLVGKENLSAFERNKTNIKALLKTIQSYASELEVAIDYNLVEQTKEEAVKITFIPLDGQQRLTTLFLVHWYLVQYLKLEDELKSLNKFSYATRIGAKDFCQLITTTFFDFSNSDTNISELITNNENYYSDWKKDPTVISMLSVIDEIDKVFKDKADKFENYWAGLIENNKITFDFFDLDDFELTDELYIKMNARGKKLTNFENFKAWLIKECSEDITISNWKNNFDIKWNDIFWNRKPIEQATVDIEYLNYFKALFLGDYLKEFGKNNQNFDEIKTEIVVLRDSKSNPVPFFDKASFFDSKINNYLKILDVFQLDTLNDLDDTTSVYIKKYINKPISKFIFNNQDVEKLTWWDITLNYAILNYIDKRNSIDTSFYEWLRIISNLLYNTPIEGPKMFFEASQSIDKLIDVIGSNDSVYAVIQYLNATDIDFFNATQAEEEIYKSKLIVSDPNWENSLIEVENNNYFFGQIGFIFNLLEEEVSIKNFEEVSSKVSALFSKEVLNEKSFLLIRTLLTQGNCFTQNGRNLVFYSTFAGTLRNRNENWRRFFKNKLHFIKKIINHSLFDKKDVIPSLDKIIILELKTLKQEYLVKLIQNPELLKYARKRCLRETDKGYYILGSSRISGYHVELFTYDWFTYNNEKKGVSYFYSKNEDDCPCVIVHNDKKEYFIYFENSTSKYGIYDSSVILIESVDYIDQAYKKIKNYA